MDKVKHHEMVTALVKPGAELIASLTPEKAHLQHMAIGISGEAGELLEGCMMGKGIENIIEELGDLEFYIEGARQGAGVTREEVVGRDPELIGDICDDAPAEVYIAVECSFFLDTVKKHTVYNKPIDADAMLNSMARLEAHLTNFRRDWELTREQTLDANIAKLSKRYEGLKYSDKAAQARADKVPA